MLENYYRVESRILEFDVGVIPRLKKAGRKRVSISPYVKRELSSDAKIIVALLKKQPQNTDELCKSAAVPLSTFYSIRSALQNSGVLKETEKGYALWTYDDQEEAVTQAIKKWRRIAFCDPLPAEIADETGMSPDEAEELARKIRIESGWSMLNQAVQDGATVKLGEVLGYLARKRDGKLPNFDYENESEIVKEADLCLKEHLEMLPKLDEDRGDVVSWPSNALKYLRKNYKLKERAMPFVAIIPGPKHNS